MQNELETKTLAVVPAARALKIVDDASCQRGADMLVAIKGLRDEVSASCDPVIAATHAAHKSACQQKKTLEAPLIEAEGVVKGLIGAYTVEQEHKRAEEEARLAAEAKKQAEERAMQEAADLEAQGDKATAQAIIADAIAAPPPVITVETTKVEGVSTRKAWAFRITNEALIPREFLKVDEVKLRGVVRSMGASAKIPGVQVYQETVVAARRAKVTEDVPV